ncbi:C40 family peptidase [Streptomyces caniscabiei]|uniref:NlpC/P60 family protein n=1 Tax=Streptomyces caniscabiei TaxID=2746961 RepID=A0ABU4MJF4_9ACTN|nr:C40 family peptidase [Streptomyces caniscabiei]MBE4737119.1 C40 family peptidase [Streptomyces caniscabiei]MBE4757645.1 C40 family peptidase [Streptomyces caniscabiei]MBE4770963.1 C40 family peptidase [Streptomyces caniscabiei]MBE4786764.1 C40 family peptidase [Streptomyces caniscabiei]MBE4794982.1 C40 family peptidase [Streptomyces caniscabiei]
MAPHRKPRPAGRTRAGIRTPALATAALTSVALLSQTATAAPSTDDRPSLEEVEKKVDDLYRQAGSATENYNAAKERTTKQKKKVDTLLDGVAERTEKLNEAREELGSFAAAQYRTGAATPDQASLLLADNPQDYFDQNQLMDRLTDRQQQAVDAYVTEQADAAEQRRTASDSLEKLTESQNALKTSKAKVQAKLAEARELLSTLTAQEKARLAAIEQREREEADRKAEEVARQQAAQASQETQNSQETPEPQGGTATGTETSPDTTGTTAPVEDSTYASKATKALAFARAQIGKPYVWGATGPGSYDCSGLTQAAWKAAGVDLPRTTYDQVEAGTTVPLADAKPGDLVFFYDNIGHVGLYIGNGMMIHAPKPGTYVREESIFYDGESSIHSVVRPA